MSKALHALKEKPPLTEALKVLVAGETLKLQPPELTSFRSQVEQVKQFQKKARVALDGNDMKAVDALVDEASLLPYECSEIIEVGCDVEANMWSRKVSGLLKKGGHIALFQEFLDQADSDLQIKDTHSAAAQLSLLRDSVAAGKRLGIKITRVNIYMLCIHQILCWITFT